jgi:hypothetical protein
VEGDAEYQPPLRRPGACMQSPRPRPSKLRRVLRAAGLAVACPVLLVLLNEYAFTSGTRARGGELKAIPVPAYAAARGGERDVKIMAYNIAKAFVNEDLPRFTERSTVLARLDRIADVIRAESPDLVFLSEVVWETPYNSVNQVRHLASACGFRYYAFGENTNVGLPFFRYVGGNAILSRWPLYNGDNPDLPGRQPFWVTRNNRRVLMADADIDGARVRGGKRSATPLCLRTTTSAARRRTRREGPAGPRCACPLAEKRCRASLAPALQRGTSPATRSCAASSTASAPTRACGSSRTRWPSTWSTPAGSASPGNRAASAPTFSAAATAPSSRCAPPRPCWPPAARARCTCTRPTRTARPATASPWPGAPACPSTTWRWCSSTPRCSTARRPRRSSSARRSAARAACSSIRTGSASSRSSTNAGRWRRATSSPARSTTR